MDETRDIRWKACYQPAAASGINSFENLASIFLSRVGIDLLGCEMNVFEPASKLIGRDREWSEVIQFFFDPTQQPEEYRNVKRRITQDPTQLLNVFQCLLTNAESIAELSLICYNVLQNCVQSEIKSLMLFSIWSAIRWTQVMSNQIIWPLQTFQLAREEGPLKIVNVNGMPFTLHEKPLAKEMMDSSGDVFYMMWLECNFTSGGVGMLAFTSRMGNVFPYLFKGGKFRATVSLTKEGLVAFDTGSIQTVGADFGDLELQLRKQRKRIIVHNSKYTPRMNEDWTLTMTTVDIGGRIVGVCTPYIEWLEPNAQFLHRKTVPSTLFGYKDCFSSDWLFRLPMVNAPMKGATLRPMDATLKRNNLFQRVKRKLDIKSEPAE